MSIFQIIGLLIIGTIGLTIGITKKKKLIVAISLLFLLLPLSQIVMLILMIH